MQNSIINLDDVQGSQLPSYLKNAPSIVGSTISIRNRVSLDGKNFKLVKGGVEETIRITKYDAAIDTKYVDVIILGIFPEEPDIARIFYKTAFVKGGATAPTCYSSNGKTPAADVSEKQSPTCATCAQNIVGSSVSGNNKGRACGFFRRLAVIFIEDPEFSVYSMDVKIKGLIGDSYPKDNRFSFKEYRKKLKAARNNAGIDLGHLITRLSFDTGTTPKLLFQPKEFINDEQLARVVEVIQSQAVKDALEIRWGTVDLSNEIRLEELEEIEEPALKQPDPIDPPLEIKYGKKKAVNPPQKSILTEDETSDIDRILKEAGIEE